MRKEISYEGLWNMLLKHNITSYLELCKLTGIYPSAFTKLENNNALEDDVVSRLCEYFDCSVDDLIK